MGSMCEDKFGTNSPTIITPCAICGMRYGDHCGAECPPGARKPEADPLHDLRQRYPHGHPDFARFMLDLVKLHSDKNRGYAQGGPALGNFTRCGKILELYPDFPYQHPLGWLALMKLKQLDAEMWALCQRAYERPEEHRLLDERYDDQAVYSMIAKCLLRELMQKPFEPFAQVLLKRPIQCAYHFDLEGGGARCLAVAGHEGLHQSPGGGE